MVIKTGIREVYGKLGEILSKEREIGRVLLVENKAIKSALGAITELEALAAKVNKDRATELAKLIRIYFQ